MIALYVFLCLMESGKKICFNKHLMFLECEVIDVLKSHATPGFHLLQGALRQTNCDVLVRYRSTG